VCVVLLAGLDLATTLRSPSPVVLPDQAAAATRSASPLRGLRLAGGCAQAPGNGRRRNVLPVSMASTATNPVGQTPQRFAVPVWEGVLGYVNLWPTKQIVLNECVGREKEGRPWAEGENCISVEMRKRVTSMYGQHITADGASVDYSGLGASDAFKEYCEVARELNGVDVGAMPQDEKTAFFINTYNSLIVHAITQLGPPSDLLSRLRLYATASYRIGGNVYSLNDIENGVLRGNRRAPTPLAKLPFGSEDPRAAVACSSPDPRMHFALNCGAKGCPVIRFYKTETLDKDLDRATRAFCKGVEVEGDTGKVHLSQIFKWYKDDFAPRGPGQDEALLRFVASYVDGETKEQLESALAAGTAKPHFDPYDWDLNRKKPE